MSHPSTKSRHEQLQQQQQLQQQLDDAMNISSQLQVPGSGSGGQDDSHSTDISSVHTDTNPVDDVVVPQPPDGGWGWVVVLGSFMVHVICDGVAYSFGVFLDTFVDHFNASYSEVSWIGSIMLGVTWGSGPIGSVLVNKFGCRQVCIGGSLIGFLGLIICTFAPNIYYMYFSFGLVAGFGLGLMYLPAIVSVNYYFERRRSLAIGLAVCGSGVGTFVFAPVTQILLDEYGWKGTVLIESAILLHGLLCGSVFRPLFVDDGGKKRQKLLEGGGVTPGDHQDVVVALSTLAETAAPEEAGHNEDINMNFIIPQLKITNAESVLKLTLASKDPGSRRGSVFTAATGTSNSRRHSVASSAASRLRSRRQSTVSTSSRVFGPLARQDIFYGGSLSRFPEFKANPTEFRRQSVAAASLAASRDVGDNEASAGVSTSDMRQECARMVDCRLLFDPIFMTFAVSNMLTSIGLCVPYVFLPDRGREMGASSSNAAFLISIVGISNMVGRIVFGFVSDFKCVNRLLLYNSVLVLCGLLSMLSTFCVNYPLLAAYSASFGLLIGIYICLTSIVLVDLLGLEKLSNAFGLVLLFQGIGAVMGPPIAGAVFDVTNDYDNSFHLMGACILLSGLMLFPIPYIQRYQKKLKLCYKEINN